MSSSKFLQPLLYALLASSAAVQALPNTFPIWKTNGTTSCDSAVQSFLDAKWQTCEYPSTTDGGDIYLELDVPMNKECSDYACANVGPQFKTQIQSACGDTEILLLSDSSGNSKNFNISQIRFDVTTALPSHRPYCLRDIDTGTNCIARFLRDWRGVTKTADNSTDDGFLQYQLAYCTQCARDLYFYSLNNSTDSNADTSFRIAETVLFTFNITNTNNSLVTFCGPDFVAVPPDTQDNPPMQITDRLQDVTPVMVTLRNGTATQVNPNFEVYFEFPSAWVFPAIIAGTSVGGVYVFIFIVWIASRVSYG
ncbi:uncharacterized protein BJ171DRAFT_210596 [Polychytrium aggregatum]|uniref:uncharacterized protein n=1 Tax=Polychytrium aggregatum TaxID=110093 RepID=UPI0022FEDD61|nr:uncharacterized protein BJ171DRAFT_210596 [Polychytrium aggregatum]KAI9208577.1 hypothetical protein BJ171DRAFT_210596 [Polychytrium aggregatum]